MSNETPPILDDKQYREFLSRPITCEGCGWEGFGQEFRLGGWSEGSGVGEYHCPKCERYYGAVQWPQVKPHPNSKPPTINELLAKPFPGGSTFHVLDGIPYLLVGDWDLAERWDVAPPRVISGTPFFLINEPEVSEAEFRAVVRKLHGLDGS